MENLNKFITLPSGDKMPRFGLGTYLASSNEDINLFIKSITEVGYRHIDTASYYKNEEEIGKALKKVFATGIKRSDIFIVTKLWNDDHGRAEEALKESLKRLDLDFVDLFLIHWPLATKTEGDKVTADRVPISHTWKGMENCVKQGLTRNIGVSNFNFQILNDLLSYAEIPPCCNQIELNPYLSQINFVEWMKTNNIHPVAFAPLGKAYLVDNKEDQVLQNDTILHLAQKYKKTPGQILLNWGLARGHVMIPKSANINRVKENFEAQAFEMEKADIEAVNQLNRNFRILGSLFKEGVFGQFPIFE
jgi:alcohol dehydrogenase (NADP+)